jgi:hypothetical protein
LDVNFGEFWVFAEFRQIYDFCFLPSCREMNKPKAVTEYVLNAEEGFSWKMLETFIWNVIKTTGPS